VLGAREAGYLPNIIIKPRCMGRQVDAAGLELDRLRDKTCFLITSRAWPAFYYDPMYSLLSSWIKELPEP